MALPVIRAKSSKDLAVHFSTQQQELEGEIDAVKEHIKDKKGTLKLLEEKKASLKTDVDKLVKLYGMQRRLKYEIALEKKKLDKLNERLKRVQIRNKHIQNRQDMFQKLHINVIKGLQKVHALQRVDFYDEEEKDEFVNKRFDVTENTRIRIDYLKSQENKRLDEINKAHILREQRLKRSGMAASLPQSRARSAMTKS